jgi:hypothetical protein
MGGFAATPNDFGGRKTIAHLHASNGCDRLPADAKTVAVAEPDRQRNSIGIGGVSVDAGPDRSAGPGAKAARSR